MARGGRDQGRCVGSQGQRLHRRDPARWRFRLDPLVAGRRHQAGGDGTTVDTYLRLDLDLEPAGLTARDHRAQAVESDATVCSRFFCAHEVPDASHGTGGRSAVTAAFRTVGGFCVFGKLPSHADFVHVGPSSDLFSRFDAWLTNSVEWAHARSGAIWQDAFRGGTMRAFMYRGAGPGSEFALVVGALAPSRDEAGRLFPICVAAPVIVSPELAKSAHLLPLACEEI